MHNAYGRAGRFVGRPEVGGGEKTRVIGTLAGKIGVFEQMPQGVGCLSVYKTLGYKFKIRGVFAVGITIKFPPKQFKIGA
jgi:hypothetical protein